MVIRGGRTQILKRAELGIAHGLKARESAAEDQSPAVLLAVASGTRAPSGRLAKGYFNPARSRSPVEAAPGHFRLRYDRLDTTGKMSFRRAGRMHHLGIGTAHARKRVLAIADDTTVTVIELETGEILSSHHIEPAKTYWRNAQRAPGRWPRALE